MPFRFQPLEIEGVVLIEPVIFGDTRGFFLESYRRSDFQAAGITEPFVQENHSRSRCNVLRGLHFQRAPMAQGKLVRVSSGAIFDVAVDMRAGSPTCGKWVAAHLSAENHLMIYIPPWCAHGFVVLSEEAEVLYKTTSEYSPQDEGGIMWNDSQLAIDWPVAEPILSERDRRWPLFAEVALLSEPLTLPDGSAKPAPTEPLH